MVFFVDAGSERGFLAEAPGEIDDAHARVAGRDVDQPVQRVVAAAVVDADDLETDRIDRFEESGIRNTNRCGCGGAGAGTATAADATVSMSIR
ncbi:hypothetical protein WI25_30830 [Burkholderia cepacia]|nr:hypothetical protein WI25_30830 [Burkholderia cepacia]